jgi:hypothetical protein
MNETKPSHLTGATYAAYGAVVLFTISLARFFFIPRLGLPADSPIVVQLNGGLLPVAAHLLLFPVIAALPAPPWARAAGYGWLVIDMATDIMALNGVASTISLPMKYGGHVSAALWITSSCWQAKGATRLVGLLLALDLGVYSFIPRGSFVVLLPSGLLFPIWFWLVGRLLTHKGDYQQGRVEGGEQHVPS